ncbi:MAG: glycine cleavage system protein GcvH [Candidatus Bathyarchaeia archaeon]|jgi:glycine cleavage system H protein
MVKVNDVEVPEGLHYTKEFEWVKVEGNKARIGVTDYAQKQLREIVYVELPGEGDTITQNEPYGTVESVKAVSDLVAPISGKIEQINTEVQGRPELLNEDPYNKGWLLVIAPSNMDELKKIMDHGQAVEWHKSLSKEG